MRPEHLQPTLNSLPEKPGIYQYFDDKNAIIYVGKAKNLKNRVLSYFSKEKFENYKTKVLVSKIKQIEFIVVDTEFEALLLENSLIKKYQPKFNIQLRDDKTYPWICIKKEAMPRVFPTRNLVKDGSEYYGPFPSVRTMKILLDLVKEIYKPRSCNLQLSKENINAGKFKVCLEYHIGNCLAPCVGKQSAIDYKDKIDEVRRIIKGNGLEVIKHLKEKIQTAAAEMRFEDAASMKQKLDLLENYQSKSTVVNPALHNVDVFSFVENENYAYINYFKISNGAIIQSHTLELKKQLDETKVDMLETAIIEIRTRFSSTSDLLLLPFEIDILIPGTLVEIPQRGDKKKLLELSAKNAVFFMQDRQKQQDKVAPDHHSKRILEQLKKDLRLKELPAHIECFDNSNFQGAQPVAACVVFKNARAAKKEYRHYHIKTVVGPNDFASMEEVVYRRYKRLMEEGASLPQLVIVDGGKGQLSAALKALEALNLRGKISIIGIAKRLEEIYFPNDNLPIYLDKRSESLRLIQQLRNEAHRFGITFHRKLRAKATIKTALTQIPGIGEQTAMKLLERFKSVKRVFMQNDEALLTVLNKKQLMALRKSLKGNALD